MHEPLNFADRLDGSFSGMLRWSDLDALWERVTGSGNAWYFYQVGDQLPALPLKGDGLRKALTGLDQLLRTDHDHDYCGIVYADDPEHPTLIKVYDPNNLGSSCGSCGHRILPRWLISLQRPVGILDNAPIPNNRKRWWRKLFG